jgi:hypothetical protein
MKTIVIRMKTVAILSLILLGCTASVDTTPTPPPVAQCRVTHCWPDYRCGMQAGEVRSCASGDDVTWSQPGTLGKCGEGPSCVRGALCLVRGGDSGDAIGECE